MVGISQPHSLALFLRLFEPCNSACVSVSPRLTGAALGCSSILVASSCFHCVLGDLRRVSTAVSLANASHDSRLLRSDTSCCLPSRETLKTRVQVTCGVLQTRLAVELSRITKKKTLIQSISIATTCGARADMGHSEGESRLAAQAAVREAVWLDLDLHLTSTRAPGPLR